MAFTDPFTGAIRTYWDQYVGAWTANGTNITSSANGARYLRLTYRIGDQSADGDVSVTIVTKGAGTGLSGVFARGSDDASDTTFNCYAVVYDATSATIKIILFTAGVPATLEDTLIGHTDLDSIGLRMTGTSLRALKNGVAIGLGVTNAVLTSGNMGIIDIDGHTYDDFAGPTAAQTAVDGCYVESSTGARTLYPAIMSSDRARGKAIADGLAALTPGDTLRRISVVSTADTGGIPLSAAAGTADALVKIDLNGAIVYSQTNGGLGACITPNDYQEWRNFTIWHNTGQLNGSPFGHRGVLPAAGSIPAAAAGSYSNVLFSDIRGIGPIDCFHTTSGGTRVISVRLVRCDLNSSFDTAIVINNSCAAGSTVELINCTALAQYPQSLYPPIYSGAGMGVTTRAVSCQDTDCIVTVYGGTYTSGGASTVNSAALVTLGTLNLFDCTLIATGAAALSIQRTGGTLNYSNVTLTGSTSGTITDLGTAYVPAPPTDLVVTAIPGGASFKWTMNSVNELGFTMEAGSDSAFSVKVSQAISGRTTGGVMKGLTPGTTYYFRVKATNATGSSTYSNVVSATMGNRSGGRVDRSRSRIRRVA